MKHIPVLLHKMLDSLSPKNGNTYIDATFGAGGYTRAILENAQCNVVSFDRDPSTIQIAQEFTQEFGERFQFIHDKFSNIETYIAQADGIVADFGISSMHVDNADRGFSFQKEAKLDMRMGKCEISAYSVINTFSEEKLASIIHEHSNERLAKKIAGMIFHTRKKQDIQTTTELAQIIYEAYNKPQHYKIHPATKTFQAIRIYVNQELREIQHLLSTSVNILKPKGRLVCVSFHELEDRIVKNFLIQNSPQKVKINKYSTNKDNKQADSQFTIITKKPIAPTQQEIKSNIRSRSAKLRCGEKT